MRSLPYSVRLKLSTLLPPKAYAVTDEKYEDTSSFALTKG